jgi:hypothetical protein
MTRSSIVDYRLLIESFNFTTHNAIPSGLQYGETHVIAFYDLPWIRDLSELPTKITI